MPRYTQFHASSVAPAELNGILSDYLALDRARIFRRLFVVRFGVLAAVAALVGVLFPSLPAFARWFPPAACLAPPLLVWMRERRLERRIARRLNPGRRKKVIKNS